MQSTIRIAGAIATLATGFVLYAGRNMYQTVFTEGEKVGALQAKIDMMEIKLNEHIRNQAQPTSYKVRPPGQPTIPPPDTPQPPGQSLVPDVPSTLPSLEDVKRKANGEG